jgi:hypothetical protein
MSISIKPGARVFGLSVPMLLAVMVAKDAYQEIGVDLVITAGIDGKHSAGSSHYAGNAADLRTNTVPESKRAPLAKTIQERLGPDYFCQAEKDHIHIQFKPQATYGA